MLRDKKILLGLTGSISAYKAILLLRLLIKEGADVRVVMTPSAATFVSPLNFSVLSKNKVFIDFTDKENNWNNHVDLALWADIFVIAPASLHTLSKMATGICDNMLLASYFSSRCPVLVAPAMDVDMYLHPVSQRNLRSLQDDGCTIISPGKGELASGLIGEGRLAEPEEILRQIKIQFSESRSLTGKKVLVTAGPTYEPIDPVRFIGNYSSGKMGFAIAETLALKGAEVSLITGPVHLETSISGIRRYDVTTAAEMNAVCMEMSASMDVIVMSAAVSDFRAREQAGEKIKKEGLPEMQLALEMNTDILSGLGKIKKNGQILVGFALETQNEVENALKKIKNKNLDFIVLNSLNDEGAGFKTDTNKISIIDHKGEISNFELKSKKLVALDIVAKIESLLGKGSNL
jgi:phosphopantothenoylcysteine decarboxylase/phosphopantothenate--cysteine ligase